MRYETSVVVNRPIDEVWAFMADMFNVPRYGLNTLGLRQTSPGPIGVGTTLQARVILFGFEGRLTAAVTEWDPPHAYAFSGSGMGLRLGHFRETHEATADGTKVVRTGEIEPRGILKLLSPILGLVFRRVMDASTQNLKRLLEAERC